MSGFLTLLSVAAGAFLTVALAYLFFWVAVYFTRPGRMNLNLAAPKTRFALVVPAHNEAAGINSTLQSLFSVTYPRELFDIVVVADNCTDATASVAHKAGAIVLERQDDVERGKGFALKFAFQVLLSKDYDAFVVIDADSVVDSNFLTVMDGYRQGGYKVIQTLYGIANPDANALTYLFHVGNVLENHLFYESKSRLGFPAILRGNGMCFSREILQHFPWDAFSIVEDTEYAVKLIRAGIDIPFSIETRVLAHQPETLDQARSQRVRWVAGNLKITKGSAVKLIGEGVVVKRLFLADIGVSLLVLSKPLLIMVSLLMIVLVTLNITFYQVGGNLLVWALCLSVAMGIYLGFGILVGGLDGRRLTCLVKTPAYLCWMLYIALLGLLGCGSSAWVRTKRS